MTIDFKSTSKLHTNRSVGMGESRHKFTLRALRIKSRADAIKHLVEDGQYRLGLSIRVHNDRVICSVKHNTYI